MSAVDPNIPQAKPFSVALVQWLAYFQGAVTIVGGVLLLAFRNNAEVREDYTSIEITFAGIWLIIIGLVTWWVATSYARGSRLALVIVACVTLLNLGSSVWWIFIHPVHVVGGLINIVLSAVIFYVAVLDPDTQTYFERYGH